MTKKKLNLLMFFSFLCVIVFSVILAGFIYGQLEEIFYDKIAHLVATGVEINSDLEQDLVSSLKKSSNKSEIDKGKEILKKYGYDEDFSNINHRGFRKMMIGIFFLISLFFSSFLGLMIWLKRIKRKRINDLAEYIYNINEGNYRIETQNKEDEFTILEDELYKTVVMLRESREKERKEKEKLGNNLADISHQLKTPLTSMALMIELLEDSSIKGEEALYIERLSAQIRRVNHLVSNLLIISKLDAGTLILECKPINIYELLCTAVDPLLVMIEKKEQHIFIEENSDLFFMGDFHWSNEAISNIVKNCSEHSPHGGEICIGYEQNPIYTQITIEDNGPGFYKKDIPHLFTRFYKGENSAKDSLGIGLALAQSIIKKQNGEIRVKNKKAGGAQFLIKFYSN